MYNREFDNLQHIFNGLSSDCDSRIKAQARDVVFAALPGRGRAFRSVAFAALQVCFVVVALYALYMLNRPAQYSLKHLHALSGETQSVALPDSSRIWLKGGSDFFYPEEFSGGARKVYLSGEVYAEISKNPRCPFIIDMNGNTLEVYGTSFGLKAYPESDFIEVSLVTGAVKTIVHTEDGKMHENALRPGERIRISKKSGEYTLASFNPDYYIPFKDKRVFSFDNLPLSDIIARLEVGFGVDIVLLSDANLSERFFAYFTGDESLDAILAHLSPDLKYRIAER